MKKPSDALFLLVHAMTAKEKQYFKQHAVINSDDSSNNYISLFDAINDADHYDEVLLKEQFRSTPIGSNFKFYKNYLSQALATSLYRYQSYNDYKSVIFEGCRIAEIYLQKQLFDLCDKQLKKMYALAVEHSFVYVLPYIIYIETELAIKSGEKQYLDKILQRHFEQVEEVSNWVQTDLELLHAALKVVTINKSAVAQNSIKLEQYRSVMELPVLFADITTLPVKQQRNQLAILGNCYSMLNNNKEAVKIRKKIIEMYGPISGIHPDSYKAYLSDLNNYLISAERAGVEVDVMRHLDDLLSFIQKKIFEKKSFHYLKYRTFGYVYNYKFDYYLKHGQAKQATTLYLEIAEAFKLWATHISDYELFTFYKHFLIIEFINNNYKQAANYCHTILQGSKNTVRLDVVLFAEMLLALCLYETDDRRYLKSYLTKTKRNSKQALGNQLESEVVFKLIHQLLSVTGKKEKAPILTGALKKLNHLNADKTQVDYFYDIRNWIKQKILQYKQH
jgi:hypothetical protein